MANETKKPPGSEAAIRATIRLAAARAVPHHRLARCGDAGRELTRGSIGTIPATT